MKNKEAKATAEIMRKKREMERSLNPEATL